MKSWAVELDKLYEKGAKKSFASFFIMIEPDEKLLICEASFVVCVWWRGIFMSIIGAFVFLQTYNLPRFTYNLQSGAAYTEPKYSEPTNE